MGEWRKGSAARGMGGSGNGDGVLGGCKGDPLSLRRCGCEY